MIGGYLTRPQKAQLRELYSEVGLKPCWSCGRLLPTSEFNRHRRTPDGLQARCRYCHRRQSSEIRKRHPERSAEYQRRFWQSNPCAALAISRRYRIKNRAKAAAHSKLAKAITSGKLVKPGHCSRCGANSNIHGHHEDYDKPLDVIWLCAKCHKSIHRGDSNG